MNFQPFALQSSENETRNYFRIDVKLKRHYAALEGNSLSKTQRSAVERSFVIKFSAFLIARRVSLWMFRIHLMHYGLKNLIISCLNIKPGYQEETTWEHINLIDVIRCMTHQKRSYREVETQRERCKTNQPTNNKQTFINFFLTLFLLHSRRRIQQISFLFFFRIGCMHQCIKNSSMHSWNFHHSSFGDF